MLADVVSVGRGFPTVHGEATRPESALDDLLHRALLASHRRDPHEALQQPHRIGAPGVYGPADPTHKFGVESLYGFVLPSASCMETPARTVAWLPPSGNKLIRRLTA